MAQSKACWFSKMRPFSAVDQSADIYLDRGLIISRMDDWNGPLLNMDDVALRGPHNAENIMAALAVGHVLHIPLEGIVAALKSYTPAPCGMASSAFATASTLVALESLIYFTPLISAMNSQRCGAGV